MTTGSTNSITAHTDWYATINVTTTAGTSVTVDGITKIAEYGSVTFTVYKSGSYTITGTLDGHTNTVTQYVSEAQYYYVTLYMSSTIRVNAPVNTVVTVGSESQTVTGTYVDFTVYSTGTYTVTGVLNGITTTNTVYVGSMGSTYSTTLVFGCYINIHSNNGTDVIFNGLRQTVGDTGYVRFWINGTGTYRFLCIYKGQSKEKAVVVTSTASDIDENIYFVPDEYQEVEYISIPNTAYINTEYYPTNNTELTIVAKQNASSYTSGDLGQIGCCRWTGNPFWTFGIYPRNINGTTATTTIFYGTFYSSGGTTGYINLMNSINKDDIFEYDLGLTNAKITNLNTGSVSSATITRAQTFTSTQPFWLGAFNNQGSRLSINYGTYIYSCILKENGVIVRHLIPCYRKSDNVKGMYDLVNGVFYTNDGTGTITAGPLVNLPSEYQEVEYLKSDGNQYIDTGLTSSSVTSLNVTTEFEIVTFPSSSNGLIGFINRSASVLANDMFGGVFIANHIYSYVYTTSSTQLSRYTTQAGIKYKYILDYKNNISTASLNGVTYTYNNTSQTKMMTKNFYLFKINDTSVTAGASVKMYSCSIELNGTVVRKFIPCKRKSDSVLGMYDLVNGVFYENAGTGSFTAGNPVGTDFSLPSEYTYVKYIASTSEKTQYLNLGETGTNTSGMLIKVYDNGTGTSTYIGGQAVSNGKLSIGSNSSSKVIYGFNTDNTSSISANVLRTLSNNYLNNRAKCYDDIKEFDINQTLVQTTPNIYSFCYNNNGTASSFANMRSYYAVLTSGTSISNIFIPCYRNSDNVIGMYDIVKGNFKTNAGTGEFTVGQDVN